MRLALPEEGTPLVITAQPQDWTGALDEYPSISVTAEGDGLTYQWYFRDADGAGFRASAEKDEVYDPYPMSADRNGREVYCVLTDRYGRRVTTEHAFMRLLVPEEAPALAVTAQPEDWYGFLGEYPSISVEIEGEGLTYTWYYRDAGETDFKKSSDVDAAYDAYPLTTERAGREVYCVITDARGRRVTSDTAVMAFAAPPEGYAGPVITAQPETWIGAPGEYPSICVTAEGEGLTYTWYYRDAPAADFHLSSETDAVYDSYQMEDRRDGREVYCVVTDAYGFEITSNSAFMYAAEP